MAAKSGEATPRSAHESLVHLHFPFLFSRADRVFQLDPGEQSVGKVFRSILLPRPLPKMRSLKSQETETGISLRSGLLSFYPKLSVSSMPHKSQHVKCFP